MDSALLETLKALETSLHDPQVRGNAGVLDSLLHPAFHEIGRSGRRYSRQEVIASVQNPHEQDPVMSRDFELDLLAEGLALLTYRTAHIGNNREPAHHACRTSLWQHTPLGWQIRFHQGTPEKSTD